MHCGGWSFHPSNLSAKQPFGEITAVRSQVQLILLMCVRIASLFGVLAGSIRFAAFLTSWWHRLSPTRRAPTPSMELLDAQLGDDPAAVRVRVPRQLAAVLDGPVDRQSIERAPRAWCLVALQYNKATVAKVFKLLCASGKVVQCGALITEAVHQPEELTVRKSLMLLLRACCVQARRRSPMWQRLRPWA